MLAYLLFGWIGGLIMLLTQKHPEVKFHGAQSVLLFGPLHVLQIVLGFVSGGGLFFFFGFGFGFGGIQALLGLAYTLLSLGAFVLWIVMSVLGFQLRHIKLPVIGDYAERWAAQS